ncbi:GNAT family N-acetyltransferase [Streptomyces sp. MUM 203J]|uniref:GNAT family N-acetyltransferase n=1 Tax=Streptomyces sp. MUM 203J TaxID=2791990 RepID=UPI001F048556|nr:GNAT family N-acetyltransferase [Streptomyces sp. MUM 203J]MCH0539936.1 GNAT family N-acetyltransferase [Streptomyces sp. MUM 203J]
MRDRTFALREVRTGTDLETAFDVRREVFVVEQGVPEELEFDAYDAQALHICAVRTEDGVALGTARLLYGGHAPEPIAATEGLGALGRLAVTRAARGLGVGAALVRGIEDAGRARGLTVMELSAQTQALGFYERLGYVPYGDVYPDAGIPHRAMRRAL